MKRHRYNGSPHTLLPVSWQDITKANDDVDQLERCTQTSVKKFNWRKFIRICLLGNGVNFFQATFHWKFESRVVPCHAISIKCCTKGANERVHLTHAINYFPVWYIVTYYTLSVLTGVWGKFCKLFISAWKYYQKFDKDIKTTRLVDDQPIYAYT